MILRRRSRRVVGFALLLAAWLVVAIVLSAPNQTAVKAESKKKAQKATTDTAESRHYVGSAACSRCHLAIANQFHKTSMGRSLTPITPELLKTLPLPAHYYDAKSGHHFEVRAEDGKLFQTEYQTDSGSNLVSTSGKDVFRNTHEMQWIVGTGENGFGALLMRGNYLFQAPLSYYTKPGEWNLSPGYQNGDYGFNRVIAPGCIFCHSGRAQPVAGVVGAYQKPEFTQTAIGCENCHGPGSAHVEAMGEGESYEKGKDPTIVNPARLTAHLSDDICMSCHQVGDTRVFQPGKNYLDFRPGQPLDRVMAILMVPPTRENPPREDHVEHYYSMILSKCYRDSAGKADAEQMRCTTCHDPHIEPTAAEAPAYFNGKCMSCHTQQSCTAPAAARQATAPADNCVSCHMPKRAGVAISHSSITNHRILKTPEEPFPEATYAMTTPQLPDLIRLTTVKGENTPEPGLTLLQAYGELKDQNPAYMNSYVKVLEELSMSATGNALVQAALGHQALVNGKLDEAEAHLQQAIKIDPTQPEVYVDLSNLADQKAQPADAVAMAQKAVMLDPYSQPLQKALVNRLIVARQYPEALAAMEKYMEEFPEDNFMRKMLTLAREN